MEKIYVGQIVNTFGLDGQLKVLMDDYVKLDEFYIDGFDTVFKCQKQVDNKKFVKIKMYGYDDINNVLLFVGRKIYLKEKAVETLGENEYLKTDLIGSKIVLDGKVLGEVIDVENFGASDILVFDDNGKECRVPFVFEFFNEIKINEKILVASEKFFEGAV